MGLDLKSCNDKPSVKFGLSNYWKPTPKFMRKLGDSLLAVSLFISSSTIYMEHAWIPMTAFSTGVIGKFVTNMFSE